jgi:hypothetical protein
MNDPSVALSRPEISSLDECKPQVAAPMASLVLWALGVLELTVHLASREWRSPCPATPPRATITPEDTLREAGDVDAQQALYQREMSARLAGRPRQGV